ncbi:MAG TPA: phage holin family protein [Dermatophilaceae bacterium]|nr:phage holin family protein [Dermatophilaceae bacterium]
MATEGGIPERTIGQLVSDLTRDVEGIVRSNVALAKAEVTGGAKIMGKGVGMLAAAGVLGLIGFVFLLHTAARAIALALPLWAGYLIVAVVVLIVAGILGLLGKKSLDKAQPSPNRAIAESKQTLAVIKPAGKGHAPDVGSASAATVPDVPDLPTAPAAPAAPAASVDVTGGRSTTTASA